MYLKQLTKYTSIAALFLMASCSGNKAPVTPAAPPPVKVTVEPVKLLDAVYYDEYPATVNPLNQVDLRPQVADLLPVFILKMAKT